MADVLYLLTLLGFFALMVAFVRVCERVVGKEDAAGAGSAATSAPAVAVHEEVSA